MRIFSFLFLFVFSSNIWALTTQQLLDACAANNKPCHELPFANAYVGGALDLLGSLKDSGKLNMSFSCTSTAELFNVKRIFRYIEEQHSHSADKFADKNAMLLVIKYMEERGCAEN